MVQALNLLGKPVPNLPDHAPTQIESDYDRISLTARSQRECPIQYALNPIRLEIIDNRDGSCGLPA
jgi:hypothetical protein